MEDKDVPVLKNTRGSSQYKDRLSRYTIQYNTMQYNTTQHNTKQYNTKTLHALQRWYWPNWTRRIWTKPGKIKGHRIKLRWWEILQKRLSWVFKYYFVSSHLSSRHLLWELLHDLANFLAFVWVHFGLWQLFQDRHALQYLAMGLDGLFRGQNLRSNSNNE